MKHIHKLKIKKTDSGTLRTCKCGYATWNLHQRKNNEIISLLEHNKEGGFARGIY